MPIFTLSHIGATCFNLLVVIKSMIRYDKNVFELNDYYDLQNAPSDFETTTYLQL